MIATGLGTLGLGGGFTDAEEGKASASPGGAPNRADVVVVGAGLAGLVAATTIASAGRSVVVLEARDHVGGRVKNWRCGMPPSCDCGFFIAPAHTRVRTLAKDLGVNLYEQHAVATDTGNDVLYVQGQRTEAPAGGPLNSRNVGPLFADGRTVFLKLDQMAASVSPAAPWEASSAADWDAMTMETWKQQNALTPFAKFWVDFLVWVCGAADPSDMSLLHFLGYLARLGDGKHGTDEMLDFMFFGDLVEGGLQNIPLKLAERLGDRVVLNAPVRRIAQDSGSVQVVSDALTVTAKRAIVATAPSLNALIDFQPGLPGQRAQLAQRYPQGSVSTFAAIYDRPWWRDHGWSGRAAGLDPFFVVTDNSPPDSSSGRLVATSQAGPERRYSQLPAAERERLFFDNLATYFGDEARKPLMTLERTWNGPIAAEAKWVDTSIDASWTRGCPGFLAAGVTTDYGPAVRQPFGLVHWAGTEHSTSYNTYVEGAVRSAEAVAADVSAAL